MVEHEKTQGVRFGRPDSDGGLFFGHLIVVEELYRDFIDLLLGPLPPAGFHIHAKGLRSRTSEAMEMLNGPESPVVVEATLVSAADILASGYGNYRILGVTYLITADSEKCSLYYQPDKTARVLLHTGATSIVTIMAQTYAKHRGWQNGFTGPGTSLDLGDYTAIREYARDVIAGGQAHPIRFAFVLSGVENTAFQEMQGHNFRCVENLAEHFFKIVGLNSEGRFASLRDGIPGTVLLTRASDLRTHGNLLQAFVDAWHGHVLNVLPSRSNWERLRTGGFVPVAWTDPRYLHQAALFTRYVLEEFGEVKLKRGRQLCVSDYEPILPQLLDDTLKGKAYQGLIQSCLTEVQPQYDEVMPAVQGNDLPPLQAQYKSDAATHYEALKGLAADSGTWTDEAAAAAADHARQLRGALEIIQPEEPVQQDPDWRLCFDPNTGECLSRTSPGQATFRVVLEPLPRAVFTFMIWEAMLARESGSSDAAGVSFTRLSGDQFTKAAYMGVLNDLFGSGANKSRGWLKNHILAIRRAIGDSRDSKTKRWRWIECRSSIAGAVYRLMISDQNEPRAQFKCPIVTAFKDLCDARDAVGAGNAGEAKARIASAKKHGVAVPPGVLNELGLTDLW